MKFRTYIRAVFATILTAIIIAQVFELQLMQLWRMANQRSFEEHFCVNLEFPEMNCHGDCYLGSLAVSAANGNSQNPVQITPTKDYSNLFNEEFDGNPSIQTAIVEKREFPPFTFNYHFLDNQSIFRPPQV